MVHIKSLLILFALSLFLLVFHYVGIQSYLYWSIGWYDMIAHLVGGFIIGMGTVVLFEKSGVGLRTPLLYGAGVALAVVVIWEIFELKTGITFLSSKYTLDTVLDILFGLVGAVSVIKIRFKSK